MFSLEQQPNYTHTRVNRVIDSEHGRTMGSVFTNERARCRARCIERRPKRWDRFGDSVAKGAVHTLGFGSVPERINYYVNMCQRLRQSWRICSFHKNTNVLMDPTTSKSKGAAGLRPKAWKWVSIFALLEIFGP